MGSSRSRVLSVGCRELKTRLGTYMRQIKDGATIIVTERGRPIAELRPPTTAAGGLEERLDQLAAAGLVTREVREPAPLQDFRPIIAAVPASGSASEAVIEDRAERF
jgi:prevent-host-death family protein